LLGTLGLDRVVVAGDTRFDRVQTISASVREVPIVKEFKGESRLFVAGSTWGADEELLLSLINENPDIKFIVAPHEMDAARIGRLMQRVRGGAVRYTECGTTVNSEAQVLVLDIVGLLSSVYKYADWAYIGGGFGAGIHNTLEAATFGVPIAFGVRYKKFKEAVDMVALGAACSVANAEELRAWFAPLRDDAEYLARVGDMAREYTLKNCGATDKITKSIFG
jgi:3-deoxy-D-manno-octulosonic-acid transferase